MNLKKTAVALLLLCPGLLPAQEYWQQQVDNTIAVTLDDNHHMLRGHISIQYKNNAPDTLKYIYFHLYPNAYSSDRTAFEKQAVENGKTDHYFSDEEDRGYIDSLAFSVTQPDNRGRKAGFVSTTEQDIIRLILPEPLPPGGSVTIETPFRVKIPLVFSRMGHSGQRYAISQWFPKPAVYDARGWHPMPYLDQGEFYSEYGSYNVAITLPENYIVMGTGNIQEPAERAWLDSLAALPIPPDRKDTIAVPSAARMKTVTFEEQQVHDFAWFADKQWVVRKDTIAVPGSGNIVTAYSCYHPKHQRGWAGSMQYLKNAIRGYSSAVGPYPYKTVKAVDGSLGAGGGMEYPTVTVIDGTNSEEVVEAAIVHEVGHNWFYGVLGSNERQYPWMDEGVNSFYEKKLTPGISKRYSGSLSDGDFVLYSLLSGSHDLVPADTDITLMPEGNTAADIYIKMAYYLDWLEAYMGAAPFEAAMQEYYATWQFRHPQPADFEAIFRKHADADLDWFFKEAMKTTRPVDFRILSLKQTDKSHAEIRIRNRTGMPGPVKYNLWGKDGEGNRLTLSSWTEPFTGTRTFKVVTPPVDPRWSNATIDSIIPDYNPRNNNLHTPFSLKSFAGINTTARKAVWVTPALGFNYYDGFMLGALVHNLTVPQHRFRFLLAPLYAFGSGTAAGTGMMGYTFFFDKGWLHDLQLNVSGKTFSYDKTNMNLDDYIHTRYVKVAPELVLNLRKPEWRSPVERSLSIKGYWIRENLLAFTQNPVDSLYYPSKGGYQDNFYGKVRYRHDNTRTFNPFNYTLEGQIGKSFAKLSLEANLRIDYFKKDKALYIRGYAGKFFSFADNEFDAYRYRLANTYSGQNDYLYDETYIGRSEITGTWSQQISMKEGGFKINTMQYAAQLGLSDDWLVSFNLKSDLPFWNLPIRLFADVATFSGARQSNPSGATVLYEAGIEIYGGEVFSLYIPLVMSKDFSEYTKSVYPENRFLKTITFSLNLGDFKWLDLPVKILRN